VKKPAANAITGLLDFRVRVSPDAVALVTEHGTLTFAELDAAAEALAGVLRSRGVVSRDLVAVAHDARTGWIGVLAAQKLEAISVGVGSAREVEASGAAWVIAAPRVEWAQGMTCIDPDGAAPQAVKRAAPSPADTLESVRAAGLGDHGIRHITLTSGTTGLPKGVEFTGAHVTARLTRPLGPWPQTAAYLNLFPLSALGGLFTGLEALAQGWPFIVIDAVTPHVIELCRAREVDAVHGSPLQVGQLARLVNDLGQSLPSVEVVCTAGSAPTASYLAAATRAFPRAKIFTSYGSTECGTVALGEVTMGSIETDAGTLAPDARVDIVDEQGHALPLGVEGIVRCATPVMSARYREAAGRSGAGVAGSGSGSGSVPCAVDGWFSPGDRGFLSADTGDGVRLSITGRTADVLNIGGTKVNAAEVDRVARRVSGVIDAAAFAVPSFRGNPALVLALVASAPFDGTELTQTLRDEFGGSSPNLVLTVAAVPRNTNGKVDRQRLAADFALAFAADLA
jgi:acyl-CoA synthetase (AMP-forming)/AMP-acid ligase II